MGHLPRAVADDPRRPGVRISELKRGPAGRPLHGDEAPWLKLLAFGGLALLALPLAIGFMGWMGVMLVLALGVLGALIFIAVQLVRIASRR